MNFASLTLEEIADASRTSLNTLGDLVDRKITGYTAREIHKRTGGSRVLRVPNDSLANLQRWVLKNILVTAEPHRASYAYTLGRSVGKCAERHLGARWLLKMDITQFFESIDEVDVYYLFLKEFEMSRVLAFQLARLVTYQDPAAVEPERFDYRRHRIMGYEFKIPGKLPQGAPTSGAIANLVVRDLDRRITSLSRTEGLTYTRYADDLFLSSHEYRGRPYGERIITQVSDLVRMSGLAVNASKTRLSQKGSSLMILGLHVDGSSLRLSRPIRQQIDGHLRAYRTFGIAEHAKHLGHQDLRYALAHLEGLLGYAHDVSPAWARPRREEFLRLLDSHGIHRGPFVEDRELNHTRFYQP